MNNCPKISLIFLNSGLQVQNMPFCSVYGICTYFFQCYMTRNYISSATECLDTHPEQQKIKYIDIKNYSNFNLCFFIILRYHMYNKDNILFLLWHHILGTGVLSLQFDVSCSFMWLGCFFCHILCSVAPKTVHGLYTTF